MLSFTLISLVLFSQISEYLSHEYSLIYHCLIHSDPNCNKGYTQRKQYFGYTQRKHLVLPFGSINDGPSYYKLGANDTWIYANSNNIFPKTFDINDFATECGWDFLYIHNGDSIFSPLIAALSGNFDRSSSNYLQTHDNIIAESGSFYVHFFSDESAVKEGFNLSYWSNNEKCEHLLNCSNNGFCKSNKCYCHSNWTGSKCQISHNIFKQHPECNEFYTQEYNLNQNGSKLNSWIKLIPDGPMIAGHSLLFYKNGTNQTIYSFFGYNFQMQNNFFSALFNPHLISEIFNVFNFQLTDFLWKNMSQIKRKNEFLHSPIIGQSVVYFKNYAFIFGGHDLSGHIWDPGNFKDNLVLTHLNFSSPSLYLIYDFEKDLFTSSNVTEVFGSLQYQFKDSLETLKRSLNDSTTPVTIENKGSTAESAPAPIPVTFHTSHLVQHFNVHNTSLNVTSSKIIHMFGYNPTFGFVPYVQQHNLDEDTWDIIGDECGEFKGGVVGGRAGHTSSYDEVTGKIYVLGGITFTDKSPHPLPSHNLYSYHPYTNNWMMLENCPYPISFHTSIIYRGLLIVFGGRQSPKQSSCYSSNLLAYDIAGNEWHNIPLPKWEIQIIPRIAASSILVDDDIWIIHGGFNGLVLSQTVIFNFTGHYRHCRYLIDSFFSSLKLFHEKSKNISISRAARLNVSSSSSSANAEGNQQTFIESDEEFQHVKLMFLDYLSITNMSEILDETLQKEHLDVGMDLRPEFANILLKLMPTCLLKLLYRKNLTTQFNELEQLEQHRQNLINKFTRQHCSESNIMKLTKQSLTGRRNVVAKFHNNQFIATQIDENIVKDVGNQVITISNNESLELSGINLLQNVPKYFKKFLGLAYNSLGGRTPPDLNNNSIDETSSPLENSHLHSPTTLNHFHNLFDDNDEEKNNLINSVDRIKKGEPDFHLSSNNNNNNNNNHRSSFSSENGKYDSVKLTISGGHFNGTDGRNGHSYLCLAIKDCTTCLSTLWGCVWCRDLGCVSRHQLFVYEGNNGNKSLPVKLCSLFRTYKTSIYPPPTNYLLFHDDGIYNEEDIDNLLYSNTHNSNVSSSQLPKGHTTVEGLEDRIPITEAKQCPIWSHQNCKIYTNCYACHNNPACAWVFSGRYRCITLYMIIDSVVKLYNPVQHNQQLKRAQARFNRNQSFLSTDNANNLLTLGGQAIPLSTLSSTAQDSKPKSYVNYLQSIFRSCPKPCDNYGDCLNCTKSSSGCLWCSTLNKCIHGSAYTLTYPFGQCFIWFSSPTRCPDYDAYTKSRDFALSAHSNEAPYWQMRKVKAKVFEKFFENMGALVNLNTLMGANSMNLTRDERLQIPLDEEDENEEDKESYEQLKSLGDVHPSQLENNFIETTNQTSLHLLTHTTATPLNGNITDSEAIHSNQQIVKKDYNASKMPTYFHEICVHYKSCFECQQNPICGWCNDASDTGKGNCLPGGYSGPIVLNISNTSNVSNISSSFSVWECPTRFWFFTTCPACQCNGHSSCIKYYNIPRNSSVGSRPLQKSLLGEVITESHYELVNTSFTTGLCVSCPDYTVGTRCEVCGPGFYGDPRNGGTCKPCECNGHALYCDSLTGSCHCTTKGIIGHHCQYCDIASQYNGNPLNGGTCYYVLTTDYLFTFNLTKPEDSYLNSLNMINYLTKPDNSIELKIACLGQPKVNISYLKEGSVNPIELLTNHVCQKQFTMEIDAKFFTSQRHPPTTTPSANSDNPNFNSKSPEPILAVAPKSRIYDYVLVLTDKGSSIKSEIVAVRSLPSSKNGGPSSASLLTSASNSINTKLTGYSNVTFYLYFYDFETPIMIYVSFSHTPKLDILQFFITFLSCFLFLLFIAAISWKVKQKYDLYRRRQRLFIEMEQMATRPFTSMFLYLESRLPSFYVKKKRRNRPTPIAIEPLLDETCAILTVIVRLPTDKDKEGNPITPYGASGIALGSTLVSMGNLNLLPEINVASREALLARGNERRLNKDLTHYDPFRIVRERRLLSPRSIFLSSRRLRHRRQRRNIMRTNLEGTNLFRFRDGNNRYEIPGQMNTNDTYGLPPSGIRTNLECYARRLNPFKNHRGHVTLNRAVNIDDSTTNQQTSSPTFPDTQDVLAPLNSSTEQIMVHTDDQPISVMNHNNNPTYVVDSNSWRRWWKTMLQQQNKSQGHHLPLTTPVTAVSVDNFLENLPAVDMPEPTLRRVRVEGYDDMLRKFLHPNPDVANPPPTHPTAADTSRVVLHSADPLTGELSQHLCGTDPDSPSSTFTSSFPRVFQTGIQSSLKQLNRQDNSSTSLHQEATTKQEIHNNVIL